MANGRTSNVIYVDTTATFTGPFCVTGIKYIGASSGTLVITAADSGVRVYEEAGTANLQVDDAEFYVGAAGITVTVANSAKCYIYIE